MITMTVSTDWLICVCLYTSPLRLLSSIVSDFCSQPWLIPIGLRWPGEAACKTCVEQAHEHLSRIWYPCFSSGELRHFQRIPGCPEDIKSSRAFRRGWGYFPGKPLGSAATASRPVRGAGKIFPPLCWGCGGKGESLYRIQIKLED
jgi:hypothetical protein